MTTKSLIRTEWPDAFARGGEYLRTRVSTPLAFGDHTVRVAAEPLLRRGESGELEQSVLVMSPVPLGQADVRDSDGQSILRGTQVLECGLRVFVPEFAAETEVRLRLPELAADQAHPVAVGAVRHWDIHLVHHTHLDIGYTDPQGRVVAEHLSYLDSALRLVRETDALDDDARFRWSVESLWSFYEWAQNRPKEVVDEFIEQVKLGRIELTGLPFNLQSEACSTDELHELLRMAEQVRDTYGVSITSAMQTDVPGQVAGLVDALAANGVKHLAVAHNWAGRATPQLTGGQDLPRLFWWSSPSGERVLVWVTDTPHGLAYMEGPLLGFDTSYEMVEDKLPAYLTALATQPYPFDEGQFWVLLGDKPLTREPYPHDILHLRVQGHFADNAPPRRLMSETVKRWNEQWIFPHLRLSTNTDFFTEAKARVGDALPTFTGDWNDWWADGLGSGARPMQLVRRAQSTVADAQTIGAIAEVLGAQGAAGDRAALNSVYLNMSLFNEHTWGAADPSGHGDDHVHSGDEQWHWKYHKALQAYDDARTLKVRSKSRLARRLNRAAGVVASVYAVNTTAAERRGIVKFFLHESRVPLDACLTAIDSRTGKELPFVVRPQINEIHRESGRFLEVAVDAVPPVGMVRVDLVQADALPEAAAVATWGEPVLENEHLRVEVDLATASIRSIFVKQLGRELVRADTTFGFNAFVYDTYSSIGGVNMKSCMLIGDDNLTLMGNRSVARAAALIEIGRDALRSWLTYETSGAGAEFVRTTLSLDHGSDRLDIINRLAKTSTYLKESAFFAFPFQGSTDTSIRWDISGSVAGAGIGAVPGGAQHMHAVRNWIALHDDGVGIALTTPDAPLVQIGDIALPYQPFPGTLPAREENTVFSWLHNNIWDTNFPAHQVFEMSFRYSVSAAAAETAEAACAFAAKTSTALTQRLSGVVADGPVRDDAPAETSLLALDDDRVLLVGATTPADGKVLLRLESVAETAIDLGVEVNATVQGAKQVSYLGLAGEDVPVADGRLTMPVPALSTAAFLIEVQPG